MTKYDAEYRRLAKAANQRFREFEKRGMTTPAMLNAKAHISMTRGIKGEHARFSETGKAADAAALEREKEFIRKFMEMETSTVSGYKQYREEILSASEEKYNYKDYGLSDDDWLSIWENLPDSERRYGSEQYIAIVQLAMQKKRSKKPLDIGKLVQKFNAGKTYGAAAKAIGLTTKEINERVKQFAE